MIREINKEDYSLANSLLKDYKYSIDSFLNNPYEHIIMYEDKGLLIYSKIYERIEIDYIVVDTKYRCLGIGSKLLNYIIDNNNIDNITLEVRESNDIAIKFYEHNGFKRVAIRDNYYDNENGILMIRKFDKND